MASGVSQVGFAVLAPDFNAPMFITQPISATVNVGASVSFVADASGVPTPSYQ